MHICIHMYTHTYILKYTMLMLMLVTSPIQVCILLQELKYTFQSLVPNIGE